jgi:hypothetical protein
MSRDRRPPYSRDEQAGEIKISIPTKLLEKLPASNSRRKALDEIHTNLAVASLIFTHHGDHGRTGVYRAMLDLTDYFASLGVPRAVLEPITAVAAALVDAERGIESPLFRPKRKKGGRPPLSLMQLQFEGYLAVVTECCVRDCKNKGMRPFLKPAFDMAAKLIRRSKWKARVESDQLRQIRERVSQGSSSDPDRQIWEQMLSSPIASQHPLAWAKSLLAHDWASRPPA